MTINGKEDPAPHALDIHHEELSSLVDRVTLEVQNGVRELREELDSIMRAVGERQDSTQTVVHQYVNDARAVHSVVKVIREHAEELKGKLKIVEAAANPLAQMKAPPPMLEEALRTAEAALVNKRQPMLGPAEPIEDAIAKIIPKGRPTREPQIP